MDGDRKLAVEVTGSKNPTVARQFEAFTVSELLQSYRELKDKPLQEAHRKIIQLDLEIVRRYSNMEYLTVHAVRTTVDAAWKNMRARIAHEKVAHEKRVQKALERVASVSIPRKSA